MRKRRLLLLSILAAVVVPLVGLGVYLLLPPRPGPTLENMRRVRRGMAVREVETLMGRKGEWVVMHPYPDGTCYARELWSIDGGTIRVYFNKGIADDAGFVVDDEEVESVPDEPEWRGSLRYWIGW